MEDSIMDEIMAEVESLNKSIEECCPEIISVSKYPSIQEMGDEMNQLIEHRIKLLSEGSKTRSESKKA